MVLASGALVALLAATCLYLVVRDDFIGKAAAHRARLQETYENRIFALEAEIERLTSRQTAEQESLQRRITELLERQERLSERHSWLGPVLERAEDLRATGEPIPFPTPRPEVRASIDEDEIDHAAITGSAFAGSAAPNIHWPIRGGGEAGRTDALFHALDRSLRDLETEQTAEIGRLADETYQTVEAIGSALEAAGIEMAGRHGEEGAGGPLIAAMGGTPFEERVRELEEALDRLESVKRTVRRLPIISPVPGAAVTSGFGMRRDPLLGRPAYHPGLDLRAAPGSPVRAAAAGTIVEAGWNGGYGRMIEIDHGDGMRTRYAHLSGMLVRKGDKVSDGEVIGRVGSSGRSTGPHLHYEVRKGGVPVNPQKFMTAGQSLGKLL
ncbi:peptidoglycan DD-metalloendopeptidase family protein [Chelativorans sp. AA-79]|uniref:peptidoglycan DD-metalloendopeptidase family protein n=1 Tax=Chelativorans sp. AA-79 TaxID=3028735 RepID=UPI0023F78CD1|nr:peptidoglycan DD-metalloendopeptidase family protein [Chelativorans sp. AA-79]WEX07310.1 peptidoglycan DD-metalloendopeptidase family protein [Chelativorans sp. AA-79]